MSIELVNFLKSPDARIDEIPHKIEDAFSVRGQVAIITGASGWIGHKIAEVFAANGAKIAVSDRDTEGLALVANKLAAQGAKSIPADLQSRDELVALVEKTVAHFGKLDAIIHCGAIAASRPMMHEPEEDFDRLFHTNVKSAWVLARAGLAHLEKTQGCIVNISSVNAHRAMFPGPLYAGTKAAVSIMTREMATEFGEKQVRANTVSPGVVLCLPKQIENMRSKLTPEAFAGYEKFAWERVTDAGRTTQPLKRGGRPIDVAMACLYLCSPAARFVSGADILVDGAMTVQFPGHKDDPQSWWAQLREHLKTLPEQAWREKPEWLTNK